MKDKLTSLILGFVLSLAVIIGAMYFFTRPDKTLQQKQQNLFSQSTVNEITEDTNGLQNYGNLPLTVGGDQIGRSNPFDSYK